MSTDTTLEAAASLSAVVASVPSATAVSILRRAVEQAFVEALPAYWVRRAATFEDARPRPGDFTGAATPEQLRERDTRLAEQANACRSAAVFAALYGVEMLIGGDDV